ncbi:YceK/YidQ family lipoprotein [Desulfuromonas sp. KJ2020]|uniref:YceK/YidQ family lipoprotein n=1 Tax=Desulfuromonas sp. KJ2020 TaxID=2919173 RepID=UPI0020A72A52|nr:YceK/YidQ family lipoprotein [Desulfuromonas sp. KJ2020]MCP3176524.1 YceK/YidQ family lipoprotein [Desulfuromonas sp. KJ2020]
MKKFNVIFIFVSVFLINGCSTIEHRLSSPEKKAEFQDYGIVQDGIYPATRQDFLALKYIPNSEYRPGQVDYLSNAILACFVVIDIPISIVFDTIFLPHDLNIKNEPDTEVKSITEKNKEY